MMISRSIGSYPESQSLAVKEMTMKTGC